MFSSRPLADLPTELHDPSGWAAPGTSLCLHGVPVPSRVLGFSVAWHRDRGALAPEAVEPTASERNRDEPSAPTPLRLVLSDARVRTRGDRPIAAA